MSEEQKKKFNLMAGSFRAGDGDLGASLFDELISEAKQEGFNEGVKSGLISKNFVDKIKQEERERIYKEINLVKQQECGLSDVVIKEIIFNK